MPCCPECERKSGKKHAAGHGHRNRLGNYFLGETCAGWEVGRERSQPLPCAARLLLARLVPQLTPPALCLPLSHAPSLCLPLRSPGADGAGVRQCLGARRRPPRSCAQPARGARRTPRLHPPSLMSSPGGAGRCFTLESGTNIAAAGGNAHLSLQVSASPGCARLVRGVCAVRHNHV